MGSAPSGQETRLRSELCRIPRKEDADEAARYGGNHRMNEKDYMIRAVAADEQIRAFAVTSRNLVEEARKAHNTCRGIGKNALWGADDDEPSKESG